MEKAQIRNGFQKDRLQQQVHEAIVKLHVFFEGWLGGVLERNATNEQYLEAQFTADFTMVSPQGVVQERPDVVEGLKKAWGAVPGLKIRITHVRILSDSSESVVAVYKEEQLTHHLLNERRSTVLFRKKGKILAWQFVQETSISADSKGAAMIEDAALPNRIIHAGEP
jgi:hypothetical protein